MMRAWDFKHVPDEELQYIAPPPPPEGEVRERAMDSDTESSSESDDTGHNLLVMALENPEEAL